ncbi:unnamed protein product [Heterobilharzia americana]|nr:unnamed protein product [Heterobilharzia americana]
MKNSKQFSLLQWGFHRFYSYRYYISVNKICYFHSHSVYHAKSFDDRANHQTSQEIFDIDALTTKRLTSMYKQTFTWKSSIKRISLKRIYCLCTMVTRTCYQTTINTTNNPVTYNTHQQPVSYFTPKAGHFGKQWKSYQNLDEPRLLNRHVSDQYIAAALFSGSCKNLSKKGYNITIKIDNSKSDHNNHNNNNNHSSSNYSINSVNNGSQHPYFNRHIMSNVCGNLQNRNLEFKENSSAPRVHGKLRAASLPPLLSLMTGNYSTPQKSIIANTGNASPSLVNPVCHSFFPPSKCKHDGADWEDCRISIDCFGIKTTNCKYVRHLHKNFNYHFTPQSNLSTVNENRWEGLNSRYYLPLPVRIPSIHLEGKKFDHCQSIRSHSLCARSVRLSIIPLNPIYKRRSSSVKRRQCGNNLHPTSTNTDWINSVDLHHCRTVLRNCWRKNIIQRMAFKIDDFTIQEDQVKAAKDVFKRFDKRGQEKISTTDLGPAFRALNLTVKPDTLKEWADQVDDDATGFIDFNGFLICYGKKLQEDQDERDLRDAFRVLDKNKRGEIDVEDLR